MRRQQKQRLTYLGLSFMGVLGIGIFVFSALQENLMFFVTPSEIVLGGLQKGRSSKILRLGGIVEKGSVQKESLTLTISFIVTDFKERIPVKFQGITPDLFREGQGVVAEGYMEENVFVAKKILAKHDENYQPPAMNRIGVNQEK